MQPTIKKHSTKMLLIIISAAIILFVIILSAVIGSSCKKCVGKQEGHEVVEEIVRNVEEVGDSSEETTPGPDIVTHFYYTTCTDRNELPSFYTELSFPGIELKVYAFTDEKGVIQYRTYGVKRSEYSDGSNVREERGFVPIVINASEDGYKIDLKEDIFCRMQDERPGRCAVKQPPAGALPHGIVVYENSEYILQYQAAGRIMYCVYGTFDDVSYDYYECDENGIMILGSLPLRFN